MNIKSVFIFLAFSLFLSGCAVKSQGPGITVDSLLQEIQNTLIKVAQEAEGDELPALKSVDLELSTYFEKNVSGKISLYVFTLGGKASEGTMQTFKLKLVPPQSGEIQKVSMLSFSDSLSAAILETARAAKSAETRKPPLVLNTFVATIKFVVKREGSAGAKFQIALVGFELGGGVKESETNSLTITFSDRSK